MYPVAWIVWATGAAFVAFSTTNPWYLLPLVGVAWFVHTAHRRDGPWAGSFRLVGVSRVKGGPKVVRYARAPLTEFNETTADLWLTVAAPKK